MAITREKNKMHHTDKHHNFTKGFSKYIYIRKTKQQSNSIVQIIQNNVIIEIEHEETILDAQIIQRSFNSTQESLKHDYMHPIELYLYRFMTHYTDLAVTNIETKLINKMVY